MTCIRRTTGTAIVALVALSAGAHAATVEISPILRHWDPIPGFPAGHAFNFPGLLPSINGRDEVLFEGQPTGPLYPEIGPRYFLRTAAGYSALIGKGDAAPGTAPGTEFGLLSYSPLSDTGWAAVEADLSDGTRGLFRTGLAGTSLVAQEGQAAPGMGAGAVFTNLYSTRVAGDRLAFGATTTGASGDGIFWQESPTQPVRLLVRKGDAAPGTGLTFGDFQSTDLRLNAGGDVLFSAPLMQGTTNRGTSFWAGTPENLRLIARSGDTVAPGLTMSFGTLSTRAFNDAGQAALRVTLSGSGVTAQNDIALLVGEPGAWNILAREGQTAGGLAPGVTLGSLFFAQALINHDGAGVFEATLSGPGVSTSNDEAIFFGTPGDLHLVAREGDPVAGVPGQTLGNLGFFAMDRHGQIVMRATVGAAQALLLTEAGGGPAHLVSYEGGVMEVGPGEFGRINNSTLSFWTISGGEDGDGRSLSDNGVLVFHAGYRNLATNVNQSGIFLATVPEPAGASVLAVGAGALLMRPRRRGVNALRA
jgi:hypothetical protein